MKMIMQEPTSAEIINKIEAGKATRGGARKGAGRKKNPIPTTVVTLRVPVNAVKDVKRAAKIIIAAAKEGRKIYMPPPFTKPKTK